MCGVTIKLTKANIDNSVYTAEWKCDCKLFDESATVRGSNLGCCAQSIERDLLVAPDGNLRCRIFLKHSLRATHIMKVCVQHRDYWSCRDCAQFFDGRTHFFN